MPIISDLYQFTEENVNISPVQHGVYQLEEGSTVIYIGRASGASVTIRSRLQSHYRGDEGACTEFAHNYRREVSSSPIQRERELLQEFYSEYGRLPRCNSRIG